MICSRTTVGSGCIQKMAKYFLAMCVLGLQIGSSAEMPPKVQTCRQIYKAKPPADPSEYWTNLYNFTEGESCLPSITLQSIDSVVVNATDPRNCQNFYKCEGLSCLQCPCPGEETFNPVTLMCDNTNAVCQCEGQDEEVKTTTIITDISISQISPEQSTQTEKFVPPAQVGSGTPPPQTDSTNGVVIIVVIVVLTVFILLALIVGFCLWQRGVFPLNKKPNMHPSNNDGYLHTLPPQERHVYAEIDERTVGQDTPNGQLNEEARRHLQHIYAPPMPGAPPACIHHPHETFVLPATHQQRLYPHFAAYPLQTQSPTTPNRDLIRFSASSPVNKGNTSQNNNQMTSSAVGCCGECSVDRDNSSVTSCSGCSHCSGSSNQTHLENQEGFDRRTLLKYSHSTPPHTQFNFVSRQVYI